MSKTVGVALALGCALTWSISIILMRLAAMTVHPLGVNAFKNTCGCLLLVATWWLIDGSSPSRWFQLDSTNVTLLISGFLGIGIADSLYLCGLKRVGAARAAVVDCVYLPAVAVLSWLWLRESLTSLQLIGIAVVIAAILFLNMEYTPLAQQSEKRGMWIGTAMVASGVTITALAITACKPVLLNESLLYSAAYRMVAGTISSYLVLILMPDRLQILASPYRSGKPWTLAGVAVIGSYITMLLWIGGFKYEQATIAAVLNQSSSVMLVLLAPFLLKEKVTRSRAVAAVAATIGAVLVSVG